MDFRKFAAASCATAAIFASSGSASAQTMEMVDHGDVVSYKCSEPEQFYYSDYGRVMTHITCAAVFEDGYAIAVTMTLDPNHD